MNEDLREGSCDRTPFERTERKVGIFAYPLEKVYSSSDSHS